MGFAVSKPVMIEEVRKAVDSHFNSCPNSRRGSASSPPHSRRVPVDWVQVAKVGGVVLALIASMFTGTQNPKRRAVPQRGDRHRKRASTGRRRIK
jgi:hypothetical protein